MGKFYITTAIDYVNAKPHLGHAYEKICSDVLARWHRLLGDDTFLLTGTDENAQKNVQAAKEAKKSVKDFVDENSEKFKLLCKKLNISNDDFIRTIEERHIKVAQAIFKKVFDKGDIYKGEYSGFYCQGCEAFITEKELVDGKCPEHEKAPTILKEETYFFKMSNYEKELLEWLETPGSIWPEGRRIEILNRVKSEELKDLSVSRHNLEWGIPLPNDPTHKIYVWFDALINYVSGVDYPDGEKYKKYWPADVHMIGKGINWFHTVIWPTMLLAADIPLPKTVIVHGYVNISGKKMSKSTGTAIDPIELIETYGTDALRYFLLREITFGQDGDFSDETIISRNNNELANELGNLLSRTLSIAEKKLNSEVNKGPLEINIDITKAKEHMEKFELTQALSEIYRFIQTGNKYISEKEPWNQEGEDLNNTIYNALELLRCLSILLYPFIPNSCEKIAEQLGTKIISLNDCKIGLEKKYKINKGDILFKKIE